MTYFSANAQNETYYACSLARAFTALGHTQNGCVYGIFYQSMLKQALACVQSCQSIHCARTYTKWVCLWHLLSVNGQTSLSMCAVSPEPSLLSHMHKIGVHLVYSSSYCSDADEHACSLARAFTALTHAQNGRTYGTFFQSMLRRAWACAQSRQSLCGSHIDKMNIDKELGQSLCTFTDRIYTYLISTKTLCDGSNIIHV